MPSSTRCGGCWRTSRPGAWLGQGTVEDLATRIAACLPPRDGRTAEDSHAAAMTIARGLLEFAVADLDPKLFQQVLLTRLQRMETDQASALDEALLDLHADLAARFTGVMGQLKRVLDRLPPGPAQPGRDRGVSQDADRLAEHRPVAAGPAVRRACAHPGRHRTQAAGHCHGPGGRAGPRRRRSGTAVPAAGHAGRAGLGQDLAGQAHSPALRRGSPRGPGGGRDSR